MSDDRDKETASIMDVWIECTTIITECVAGIIQAFQSLMRLRNRLAICEKLQSLHFPERLVSRIAFSLPDWVIDKLAERFMEEREDEEQFALEQ